MAASVPRIYCSSYPINKIICADWAICLNLSATPQNGRPAVLHTAWCCQGMKSHILKACSGVCRIHLYVKNRLSWNDKALLNFCSELLAMACMKYKIKILEARLYFFLRHVLSAYHYKCIKKISPSFCWTFWWTRASIFSLSPEASCCTLGNFIYMHIICNLTDSYRTFEGIQSDAHMHVNEHPRTVFSVVTEKSF